MQSFSVLDPQKALRIAAGKNDVKTIEKLLALPGLDVNAADPMTGRTALHETSVHSCREAASILLVRGKANRLLRDKLGFTTLELAVNQLDFAEEKLLEAIQVKQSREIYCRAYVDDANAKSPKTAIVFINHIEEIDVYIEKNPKKNKIGFIIAVPNCLRGKEDSHVVPIYFEKENDTESFICLDSAMGRAIIVPMKTGQKRELFYNPFRRQAADEGCFEDAIEILQTLLNSNGIVKYCRDNSKEDSDMLTLNNQELLLRNELAKKRSELGELQLKQLDALARKTDFWQQSKVLQGDKNKYPLQVVYKLSSLPKVLLPFIERYDTMRAIRVAQSSQFFKTKPDGSTYLEYMLKHGKKRDAAMSDDEIKKHIAEDDKAYDFAGIDFNDRCQRYEKKYIDAFNKRSNQLVTFFAEQGAASKDAADITEIIMEYGMTI